MSIVDKVKDKIQIKSIGEGFGQYTKPDPKTNDRYVENLWKNQNALSYLEGRGLTHQTIKHFKLGYCDSRNAVSIPIFKNKELINIRYRSLDPKAKVRYTQEKGCETWIYNEDGIQDGLKIKGVLVVEGEFDLMSVWQSGIKHVVSPSSGATSFGPWIELLDNIPYVWIAYDNDKAGKNAAYDFAQRVGIDKCFEVIYPEGIKDANDYFKKHNREEFTKLVKSGEPFYSYVFESVPDVIKDWRENKVKKLSIDIIPYVEFEEDWLAIISGDSNTGKTSWALNVASELADKNIPNLIMPFERGIKSVGKRFLQVRHDKEESEFNLFNDDDWKVIIDDARDLPVYFSTPKVEDLEDVVRRGKRLFDIKFVIIDHLDYMVRGDRYNTEREAQSEAMMKFKSLAQELGVIFIVVHHIKKPEGYGKPRRLKKEDLKGSASLYQDPEVVVLLDQPEDSDNLELNIAKNKGPMGIKKLKFNRPTGKMRVMSDAEVRLEEDDGFNGL